MKNIFLFFILISHAPHCLSDVSFGLDIGYGRISSQVFGDKNLYPKGPDLNFKLGLRNKSLEFGAYASKKKGTTTLTHDNIDSDVEWDLNSLGTYFCYHKEKYFLKFSYGKASIKKSLKDTSAFTSSQNTILNDLYNFEEVNVSEARVALGIRLFRLTGLEHSVLLERSFIQYQSTHTDSILWSIKLSL